MVDPKGDIQDRDEVYPDADDRYGLIKELVQDRGGVHVYYPNHRDETDGAHDDIHLDSDHVYFFDNMEVIFVQDEGVQRWLFPSDVLFLEKHE